MIDESTFEQSQWPEGPEDMSFEVKQTLGGSTYIQVVMEGEPKDWPIESVQAGKALIEAWLEVDRITPETAKELAAVLKKADISKKVTREELKTFTATSFDKESLLPKKEKPGVSVRIPTKDRGEWQKIFESTGLTPDEAKDIMDALLSKTDEKGQGIESVHISPTDIDNWIQALLQDGDFSTEEIIELLKPLVKTDDQD